MQNIVSDSPITCPEWCTTDHTLDLAQLDDPAHWIVHDSDPQRFGVLVTQTDAGDVPTELVQTRSELPDGTLVQEGALLNGVFLDLGGLKALGGQLAAVSA